MEQMVKRDPTRTVPTYPFVKTGGATGGVGDNGRTFAGSTPDWNGS